MSAITTGRRAVLGRHGPADPRAAVDFYAGLFGWEFVGPGPMPGGGEYFVARVAGRDVAGVSSLPAQGGPPGAGVEHPHRGEERRRRRGQGERSGRDA